MLVKSRARAALAVVVACLALACAASGAAASPPGANDWSCRPSAAHPEPVVLLHGLFATADVNWFYHSPKLAAQGYCVFAPTYGTGVAGPFAGGLEPMADSAAEIGAYVDRVLAATGAAEVNVVGHSEGTTVAAYYLKNLGGAAKVKRFVGLAPNYYGTTLYGLNQLADALAVVFPGVAGVVDDNCGACRELLTGSPFTRALTAGGVTVPGVTYTNLVSRYDQVVVPYTNGVLAEPGVNNVVLQQSCPIDVVGHLAQAIDPNVARQISNALDPAHARSRCLPFFVPA